MDWNNDNVLDLFGIFKAGANKTEVHIRSGADGFQTVLFDIQTGLGPTNANWEFAVADWDLQGKPDLIAVNKAGATTEVHVFSGESSFVTPVAQYPTPLEPTGDSWTFEAGDYNDDGYPDVVGIKMYNTGSVKTEVHILSGKRNGIGWPFQDWLLHKATPLGYTNRNYWGFGTNDWNRDGSFELFIIKKQGASGKTEVNILKG